MPMDSNRHRCGWLPIPTTHASTLADKRKQNITHRVHDRNTNKNDGNGWQSLRRFDSQPPSLCFCVSVSCMRTLNVYALADRQHIEKNDIQNVQCSLTNTSERRHACANAKTHTYGVSISRYSIIICIQNRTLKCVRSIRRQDTWHVHIAWTADTPQSQSSHAVIDTDKFIQIFVFSFSFFVLFCCFCSILITFRLHLHYFGCVLFHERISD